MKLDTIYNMDCIDGMAEHIPDNSIDLIFADPPYWMRTDGELTRADNTKFNGCTDSWDKFNTLEDYKCFTEQWLKSCKRVLKHNGSMWVIGDMRCIHVIGNIMQELGFWIINEVIWHKSNPTPNFKGTRLNNSHETMLWATKNKTSRYTFHYKTAKELNTDTVTQEEFDKGVRKQMGSVWKYPICSGAERLKDDNGVKLHNTQKPQKLLERLITISSNIGDIILDPFGGTMTTGAAAKKTGRHYIIFEQDAKYCKYGTRRLSNIQFEDTPIVRALFDEKPIKVSITEMISAGYFTVGEHFYTKDGKSIATLTSEGKLNYNNEILDIHSCAARSSGSKAVRLNGYNYWYVYRDNILTSIDDVRKKYRGILTKTGVQNETH